MAHNANRSSIQNVVVGGSSENAHGHGGTRTYPGTASRVTAEPTTVIGTNNHTNSRLGGGGIGSVPTVFLRPLSRSQLAPVHGGSGGVNGSILDSRRAPSPPARPLPPISLDAPRPNSERHRNLYLGAPLPSHTISRPSNTTTNLISLPPLSPNRNTSPSNHNNHHHSTTNNSVKVNRTNSSITAAEQVRLPSSSSRKSNSSTPTKQSDSSSLNHSQGRVVTTQPTARGLLEPENGKVRLAEPSIICPYCRKCRCKACATPRPLPSRWICSKNIKCGPEPILDYVTCLCCVKGLFYHCGKNHEPDGGVMCADKPCSCAPHRKFWRWGCMLGMSVFLPCLCLYWPCKGCLCIVEKAYQKYHHNGCNCRQPPEPVSVCQYDCISCDQHTNISGMTDRPILPVLGPNGHSHTPNNRANELHKIRAKNVL